MRDSRIGFSAAQRSRIFQHLTRAEDNPLNQPVARGFLTKLACTVDVAANGEEAPRLFDAARLFGP